MKSYTTLKNHTMRRTMLVGYLAGLAMALTTLLPQSSSAGPLTPPSVPATLQVPAGNKLFLKGHAFGTQQYVCLSPGTSAPWAFFGPQATLFKENGKQILTHFLSPNPEESGTARPTWQDSKDTSTVWARPIATSSDPQFVAPGAIPWLLLEVAGAQDGPTGGDTLSSTTFVQRVHTAGGVAPSSGCAVPTDIGKKALVAYETDYFFYKDTNDEVNERE